MAGESIIRVVYITVLIYTLAESIETDKNNNSTDRNIQRRLLSQPAINKRMEIESKGDSYEYQSDYYDHDYDYEDDYNYAEYHYEDIEYIDHRSNINGRNYYHDYYDHNYYNDYYDHDYYYDYDDDGCLKDEYSASKSCCKWECTPKWQMYPNYCNCDDLCQFFNDCCENIDVSSDKNFTILNVSFDCLYIPGIYDLWFVFIVNTCPDGTDYELHKLCTEPNEQDIYSTTPTSSLRTRFLYRNMYCAMCNGEEDYVFWKVVLRCHWKPDEHSKFGHFSTDELYKNLRDNCFLFYKEPFDNSYRMCYPAISSCPEASNDSTSSWSNRSAVNLTSCEDGGNRYLYTSDAIYKNPACYECNKDNSTEQASCDSSVFAEKQFYDNLYHGKYSVNVLFDLPTQQSTVTRYMYNKSTTVQHLSFVGKCGPNEAYDPFNGECKNVCSTNDKKLYQ